jgi:hypothetical protein
MDEPKSRGKKRCLETDEWATQSFDEDEALPKLLVSHDKRRVRSTVSITDDLMCSRCTAIRIEEAIIPPCPLSTKFIALLGEIDEEMRCASCPLCRLLAAVYNPQSVRQKRDNTHHLRAFESRMALGPIVWPLSTSGEYGVILGVCRGSKKELGIGERQRCLTQGFIAPLASLSPAKYLDPQSKFQVQEVKPKITSFMQVKQWLDICSRTHDGTCKIQTKDRSSKAKYIDVYNRVDMVPTSINTEEDYLALSYVCSEACERHSCQQGSDMTHVCQTIEDALAVTHSLGFRYLWVDKYCINQHDDEEKRAAIATMDHIYEGASLTLVAAPLPNSRPGLPGMSRERQSFQPTARIGETLWASTLPHLSVAVSASTWVTRGWTYQEMVLSTRCLFFTDEQIYFLCQQGTASESVAVSSGMDLPSLGLRKFRSYALSTDLTNRRQRPEGLWQFFEDLYNYKCRELSFDIDSLNAFQGILKRSGFKDIWGIPIAYHIPNISAMEESDLTLAFLRGLWWENPGHRLYNALSIDHKHASCRRRSQFPSWSWTGWKGPVSPHNLRGDLSADDPCNAVSDQQPEIGFYFETARGSLRNMKQVIANATLELSHIMHIATTTYRVRIRRPTLTHKMPHICECHIKKIQCAGGHTMVQSVRLFQDPYLLEPPEDLFERYWYVVRLFIVKGRSAVSSPTIAAFIADWDGKPEHCAQVIGVAYLDLHSLPAGNDEIIKLS